MLVLERQKNILDKLERLGSVRVTDLAREFGVTEETIRRDLDKLEEEGGLRRSHGGAVALKDKGREVPYWFREITHEKEKATIAHHALELIQEGDRIILDASTTAWHIAKRLRDMELTVVTNSIRVAVALSEHEKVKVISVGGLLSPRSLSYVGPQAVENMRQYHVDKLFFSCAGVDVERGLSDLTDEQASVRRCMLKQADTRYLLTDSSKVGVKALAMIGPLNVVDDIIINEMPEGRFVEEARAMDIKVDVILEQQKNPEACAV